MNTTDWWVALTIAQKEHIATKIAKKEIHYPECTEIWNKIEEEKKQSIQKHCIEEHWFDGNKEKEGVTYSY